jgi:tRNA (cmo5U34)-methyltransferase
MEVARMSRDEIFLTPAQRTSDFAFDDTVAAAFDDMAVRSIPFYLEQQRMIAELAARFWIPGSTVYDLGCATGTTLVALAQAIPEAPALIGYDNSAAMLRSAEAKIAAHGLARRIETRFIDLEGDLSATPLAGAGVVVMCWTLQFIRPMRRDPLVAWIHRQLPPHGVLIVTEKILAAHRAMNAVFIDCYYELKRRNGYSQTEISRKREALENVLIPYRADEHLALFRRNGFQIVEPFFQWHNFAGFLCVKESGRRGER